MRVLFACVATAVSGVIGCTDSDQPSSPDWLRPGKLLYAGVCNPAERDQKSSSVPLPSAVSLR
jgi:hypothetical protein